MQSFRDIPIQRKLIDVILFSSMITLLLASGGAFLFQRIYARAMVKGDLETQARIIAAIASTALRLNDASSADEILATLKPMPYLLGAGLLLPDGRSLSRFGSLGHDSDLAVEPTPDGFRFEGSDLVLQHSLLSNGQGLGRLWLRYDFGARQREISRLYGAVFTFVFLVSLLLALFLSSKMQRIISVPILKLADTARLIADKQDYTVRAPGVGRDELGVLTDAFNRMLERLQQQDLALRESESRYRLLFIHNPLSMLVYDRESLALLAVNEAAVHHYKYSAEEFLHKSLQDLWLPDEAPALLAKQAEDESLLTAMGHGRHRRRDGKVIEVETTAHRIEFGGRPARLMVCHDITKRQRTQARMEELHRRMLDISHKAGMAEVATGVLHNVGNVLNSINVSTSLLIDAVRQSKAASLPRIAALLEEHADDFGAFLTQNSQGRQLQEYLALLAQYLEEERTQLLNELDSIRHHVAHIHEIVAMQQDFAKVSGVVERVALAALVEDALKLNAAALSRHGVQVKREYAEVPPILVEKNKVLQILINLIGNAQCALVESGREDKRLTLQVQRNGTDRVRVQVVDNGIGIAPENLTRIFGHGFTTRTNGHGFGLHSGALAARELGGVLHAHSDGIRQGATFSLNLPLNRMKSS